jgi:hypothetical protein
MAWQSQKNVENMIDRHFGVNINIFQDETNF